MHGTTIKIACMFEYLVSLRRLLTASVKLYLV